MARVLQPCDWCERDVYDPETRAKQYVVEVFGRTDAGKVACLRIKGFRPYFYTSQAVKGGVPEDKYDVMAGFQELRTTRVWKVVCQTKAEFGERSRNTPGVLYETNLHPFLRLFHERHLGPASPLRFKGMQYSVPVDRSDEGEDPEPLYAVDEFYQCKVGDLEPCEANIPLKVACYDLEMYSASGMFPQAKKDPIVQIGISYRWSNDMLTPIRKQVFVLGSVSPSEEAGTTFVACRDEEDMLYKFHHEVRKENPDVMCGYNTFGFDDAYIEDRCRALGIEDAIQLGRFRMVAPKRGRDGELNFQTKFSETKKFELASGKYDLRFLMMRGRLGLDLLLNMRREHSLDSFKLDNVASVFLRNKVTNYLGGRVMTKSTRGLRNGNYIRFDIVGNTSDPYREGYKFLVSDVQIGSFRIEHDNTLFEELTQKERESLEWSFTKDDVEPHELFRLHAEGGPEGRARIAKYCIQDCDLVLTLMGRLDTLVNARGMADVCKVPMEYVLRRGQGIKIFSAVVYYASQRNQIIRTQSAGDSDEGYEGAIVISPKIGMYLDQPISVLDFNSLYPTNMIAYNISPDTLVSVRSFNDEGAEIKELSEGLDKAGREALVAKGYVVDSITYDNKAEDGTIRGSTTCYYVQPNKDPMVQGILPKTLDILLKKRKEFKEKMEDKQYDESQRSVYNGLQLAYKVVANSVYGQTGSQTSPIRKLCVAACTTAAGRQALGIAKRVVEAAPFNASVIYGDTDSIFVKFPTTDLSESIQLGIAAGKAITAECRRPYKIAYEKTFYPFILFCRKRYVGMKYEEDPSPSKAKRMSMGIVLKRRDNAPIVKDIFGGALDILMQERDVKKAQAFTNQMLLKVLNHEVPLEKFIITKSLRDDYAAMKEGYTGTATLPSHRVLADRMASRDAGTAPKVGDRVAFIYVAENKHKGKQGDRIEDVNYVRDNDLHPDTEFYITNQIQNPVAQLFALCIDQLDGYVEPRKPSYTTLMDLMMEKHQDEEKATLAVLDAKERQLDSMLFLGSPVLSKIVRSRVRGPMDAFLKR
jgi:DNA polymerase elongation subunit (family B)